MYACTLSKTLLEVILSHIKEGHFLALFFFFFGISISNEQCELLCILNKYMETNHLLSISCCFLSPRNVGCV